MRISAVRSSILTARLDTALTLENAGWVEYFPDAQVLNFRQLLDRQLEVVDGFTNSANVTGTSTWIRIRR